MAIPLVSSLTVYCSELSRMYIDFFHFFNSKNFLLFFFKNNNATLKSLTMTKLNENEVIELIASVGYVKADSSSKPSSFVSETTMDRS